MKLLTSIILMLGLGLVYYFTSSMLMAQKIHFIVPDEFRGLITVRSAAGALDFSGKLVVPENGEILVSEISRDSKNYSITAEWNSGETLKVKSIGELIPDQIFLWILSYPSKPRMYFYVGTHQELKRFWEENYELLYATE